MKDDICNVCGDAEFKPVCVKSGFRYVSCAACGVVRQFPYPTEDEIEKYYVNYVTKKSADSVYLTDEGFSGYRNDKKLTFNDLGLDLYSFAGKRLLDVGCGTGQFVKLISEYGAASVMGIDLSKECIDSATAHGLNCKQDNFLDLHNTEYDVISMWHLIEHLLHPKQFIEHAFLLLQPEGKLIVETPVIGIVSEKFAEDWRYFMPVEHINLFTQGALFQTCKNAGFSIRSWIRFGSGNGAGSIPAIHKRAMDSIAKSMGFGDTLSAIFIKP